MVTIDCKHGTAREAFTVLLKQQERAYNTYGQKAGFDHPVATAMKAVLEETKHALNSIKDTSTK